MMVRTLRLMMKHAHARADVVNCFDVWIIADNEDYVSTELDYLGSLSGMLRARATDAGAWEDYGVCRDENNGLTYIWSTANGLYVSAELGYGGANYGMLRARATSIGPWESWHTPVDPCGDCDTYFYMAANQRYVSAELGCSGAYYGMLRARASTIGDWELFGW
jgi:hypothetical protein